MFAHVNRSEGYDLIVPLIPHLKPSPQVVFPLVVLIGLALLVPLFVPTKLIFFVAGLVPIILSHPYILPLIPLVLSSNEKHLLTRWRAFRDDDRLSDACWKCGLREVELWENERWDKEKRVWGKDAERNRWTRGADGWSPLSGEGQVSSNLTFALEPGWTFVESEDWKEDLHAAWANLRADQSE